MGGIATAQGARCHHHTQDTQRAADRSTRYITSGRFLHTRGQQRGHYQEHSDDIKQQMRCRQKRQIVGAFRESQQRAIIRGRQSEPAQQSGSDQCDERHCQDPAIAAEHQHTVPQPSHRESHRRLRREQDIPTEQ